MTGEPKYALAVFDFDGTLADSFPWFMANVNQVADRYGFRRIEAHEVDTLRGYDARQMMRHLRAPAWKLPLIAREMRSRMAAEIGRITLFDGVGEVLRTLRERGVTVAIVTSNSEANVRRVLGPESADLVRHFACGASMFGKRRKLLQVLRATGVPPSRAIKIGDEIRDLHAARSVGMAFGAVAWGFTHAEALRAHAPDEVFGSVGEMVETLIGNRE